MKYEGNNTQILCNIHFDMSLKKCKCKYTCQKGNGNIMQKHIGQKQEILNNLYAYLLYLWLWSNIR